MSDELNQDQGIENQETQDTGDQRDPNALYRADGTQVNLNDLMAKHKRQVQGELKQTKEALTETQAAQQRLKSLAEGLAGGEVEDTEAFMRDLADTVNKLDTDAERQAKKAKADAKALQQAQEAAANYQGLYETSTIERAIRDAAPVGDEGAYSKEAQDLIVAALRSKATIKDGEAIFDGGTNEEGDPVVWKASDAVADMATNRGYFPLFSATVKAGSSGEIIEGMKFNKDGGVDPADMKDFAKYRELKRKNPQALHRTFGEPTSNFGGQPNQ
jgi:hypothetical protein